jgi:peptide chain release factor 2
VYRPPRSSFDVDGKRSQIAALEQQASDPSLWDDPTHGQEITSKLARRKAEVRRYDDLIARVDDALAMDELLEDESDADLSAELRVAVGSLETDVERLELAALLSGPYDASDAIATINAGAGGTESQDWAEMLLRMYSRWAEREGFEAEVDDIQHGDEAGIKSATFTVKGTNVYGLLSAERGVHRLVRISPFDAQKRRHTSFASLDVIPMLESADEEDLDIPPEELRIDVYRSSGPGGQSVNTTDSAVRITHIPTGLVAACQNERSQLQNKAVAMRILKARLAEMERQKRSDEMDTIRGERKAVDFGSQIRSYVLAPYQMVKDHRTDEEMGDPQRVLDGDIDRFIEAELRRRAAQGGGGTG